jgi:hypothetical protein
MTRRSADRFWSIQAQPWAVVSFLVTLAISVAANYTNRMERELATASAALARAQEREIQDLKNSMRRHDAGCRNEG